MASIVSEALAGMAEEASPDMDVEIDKRQERHRAIVKDELLPKMTKIQREMKGRRYRVRSYMLSHVQSIPISTSSMTVLLTF
jgi:hypothetical protein